MKLGNTKMFEKVVIGVGEQPLMIRWILVRFPAFGIYLHKFLRSDYDRALHDHPWPFIAIILAGGYTEVHDQTTDGKHISIFHKPWSVLLRPAEWRQRVVIGDKPSWSLVIVGRRQRSWGFFLPDGWCWWRKHNPTAAICEEEVIWTTGSD